MKITRMLWHFQLTVLQCGKTPAARPAGIRFTFGLEIIARQQVGIRRGEMGIRFYCPNGHKLNVKSFQGGRKGVCPHCGAALVIPTESTRPSSKKKKTEKPGVRPDDRGPGPAVAVEPQDPAPVAKAPEEVVHQQPVSQGEAADVLSVQTPAAGADAVPTAELVKIPPTSPAEPDVPDPIAEAPDAVWYVQPSQGGQFGPAAGNVMRTWLAEGRVPGDALVWREGWAQWQKATDTFGQLPPGQRPPAVKVVADDVPATTGTPLRLLTADQTHARPRPRSNTTRLVLLIALLLAVIVMFVVLLFVLHRQMGGQSDTTDTVGSVAVSTAPPNTRCDASSISP